ncbi:MAG: GNAT family N-acetyltransferase [Candidatus Cloacimonetes bacterium]|nr:GNAT family N-acetyltransferase [Candidatus Cloacimonadota bacterium]
MNNNIKIVEYEKKYAASIAAMWNQSGDGWGGYNTEITAEKVIREEASSPHINLYLALDDNMVVGYCKLSEYREDEGALYIDLINVLPSYQGRKIGKALVLRCVQRTVELGWPRLDLYTWTGNTKAVPMYKKCGFFWEDRDDTTHLMDFIPTVLNTEILRDYFRVMDWQKDSIREIAIEPDGIRENDSEYYRYLWQKDENRLEVDFCRYGRLIRRIECREFSVSVAVAKRKLIFGRHYYVNFQITNKMEVPIKFRIRGRDDRNISFPFQQEFSITGSRIITATFFLDKIDDEQSPWKTHPRVQAAVEINDRKVLMGIGIEPLFPLSLSCQGSLKKITPLSENGLLYLDVENNFAQNASFAFSLPRQELVEFAEYDFGVALLKNERKSVPLPFRFLRSGIINTELVIKADVQGEDTIRFSRTLSAIIHGKGQPYWGESEKKIVLGYGDYQLILNKRDFCNEGHFVKDDQQGEGVYFRPPQLGKPYSYEFSKVDASKANFTEERGAVLLKLDYHSERIQQVEFSLCFRLYSDGVLETWEEIENMAMNATDAELALCRYFNFSKSSFFLHYNNRLMEFSSDTQVNIDNIDYNLISENWLFTSGKKISVGLSWSAPDSIRFGDWAMYFEHSVNKNLHPENYRSPSVFFFLNRFTNCFDFRDYLRGEKVCEGEPHQCIEFKINGGNPFIKGDLAVQVVEHRQRKFGGEFCIQSSKGSFADAGGSLLDKENEKQVFLNLKEKNSSSSDILHLQASTALQKLYRNRAIFKIGRGEIKAEVSDQEGFKTLAVDNGTIRIKCAEAFLPGIFSLTYHQQEWLDTSFPRKICKSWWNQWGGGIFALPQEMRYQTLYAQPATSRLVKFADNLGNIWQGVEIEISIREHKKYKGLGWKSFYLLMPSCPVLLIDNCIIQNTGTCLQNWNFEINGFIRSANSLERSFFRSVNNRGDISDTYAGQEEVWLVQHSFAFGGMDRKELLQLYSREPHRSCEASTDKKTLSFWVMDKLSLPSTTEFMSKPLFLIFTPEFLSSEMLTDLSNIKLQRES